MAAILCDYMFHTTTVSFQFVLQEDLNVLINDASKSQLENYATI